MTQAVSVQIIDIEVQMKCTLHIITVSISPYQVDSRRFTANLPATFLFWYQNIPFRRQRNSHQHPNPTTKWDLGIRFLPSHIKPLGGHVAKGSILKPPIATRTRGACYSSFSLRLFSLYWPSLTSYFSYLLSVSLATKYLFIESPHQSGSNTLRSSMVVGRIPGKSRDICILVFLIQVQTIGNRIVAMVRYA